MSLEQVPAATLSYARGTYKSEVGVVELQDAILIVFPNPRRHIASYTVLACIVLALPFVVQTLLPFGLARPLYPPLVLFALLSLIAIPVLAIGDWLRADRQEVLTITPQGVRVQGWYPQLERDQVLLWDDILEYRFQRSPTGQELQFLSEHKSIVVRLCRPVSSEETIIECLDRFRLAWSKQKNPRV